MNTEKKQTVVVGMSGGVDSSVAACLLQKQGYEVIGVTMKIWQEKECMVEEREGGCCGLSAVEDARRVAARLGIPYYVMNFQEEFQKQVIDYFIMEYQKGRTPNPCIACNRYIKWEALLNRSLQIGADYIATGHYARVEKLDNGRYAVRKSCTAAKDQTYALYNLTQDQLAHTLMPIGLYEKPQIRQIAKEEGLLTADKPDSMEICFVPDKDYAGFIERETNRREQEGNFVTEEGVLVGRHRGISHYTIGQRKGLELSLGEPVYVREIKKDTNEIVVGKESSLWTRQLQAGQLHYMAVEHFQEGEKYEAKIRYGQRQTACRVVKMSEDRILLEFDEPVRAVTPGQAVVLYRGEYVAGGGTIL